MRANLAFLQHPKKCVIHFRFVCLPQTMLLQLPPRTTPNGITEPETTPQWGLSLQIWSTPTKGPFQRRQVTIIVLLLLMMLMILLFYHVFNSIVVAIHLVRCFSVGSVVVVAAVVKFILLLLDNGPLIIATPGN